MKRVILLMLVAISGCQSNPDPNARCYTCEALNNNAAQAQQSSLARPIPQNQPVHCQSNSSGTVTNTYCN